jgi:hypothetical protein
LISERSDISDRYMNFCLLVDALVVFGMFTVLY